MERDVSNGGGFVLGLILLALGGVMIKEIIKNYSSHRDSSDSEKNSEPVIPKVKVIPLNRQITYRKKGNEIIDVRKIVRPSSLPYHLEKGWRKTGRVYQGYYRCRLGAFKGEIEERPCGDYKFYIFNPPHQTLNGSHKACFTNVGAVRYHIHFGVNSENLDGGIMAVERLLFQSLNGR